MVAFGGGGAAEKFGRWRAGWSGVVVPGLLVGWNATERFDGVIVGSVIHSRVGEED
jgi:hypothetical protein